MTSIEDWCKSKVASTTEALRAGDGCHEDEAAALHEYLSGDSTASEYVKRITKPITNEADPTAELYRLWALLSEALVELGTHERHKVEDLLSAIKALPTSNGVEWSELPGFGNMWSDLYRLRLHGPDSWEKDMSSMTEDRKSELRNFFQTIGTTEAEMFIRGLVVSEDWGYEVLNLVCSQRPSLDVLLSEVHAWLDIAGWKLKDTLKEQEVKEFPRPVPASQKGEQRAVRCTIVEHWAIWKEALRGLIEDESRLSSEGKQLARKSLELM